jgi:hypothetical protein
VGGGRLDRLALLHAAAIAVQAVLIARFLDLNATAALILFLGFGTLGILLALLWRWWTAMPHSLDMCFGMCTVGTLGMYVGIWVDHQFLPMPTLESLFWTYGFMLVACNGAMFTMTRHRHALDFTNRAFLAGLIGANLGMIAGMKAGALAVTWMLDAAPPLNMLCKLAGMSLGMALGMLAGQRAFQAAVGHFQRRQHKDHV